MESQQLLQSRLFAVERLTSQSADGRSLIRDVIRHPGSVVIVPLLDDGHVCLIKNCRIAVDEVLIELPAGTLEANEAPVDCALRELTEETGYRAGEMRFVTKFFAAPGILDELMHLFVAERLTAGDPAREPGEQIENHVIPLGEALELVSDGTIKDAKTILGLLLAAREKEESALHA